MTVKSFIGRNVFLDESSWGWEWIQTLNGSILAEGQLGIVTFLTAIRTEVARVYIGGPSSGAEKKMC